MWLLPGGHAPWQESKLTSPATNWQRARAATRAAQVKSSGHGATVIVTACGQRRTTPAASSRRTSQDFSMLLIRSASIGPV